MPSVPGLNADVYYGDTETDLPDWRADVSDEVSASDDDDTLTDDEEQAVISILGFDPDEESEGESGEDADGDEEET